MSQTQPPASASWPDEVFECFCTARFWTDYYFETDAEIEKIVDESLPIEERITQTVYRGPYRALDHCEWKFSLADGSVLHLTADNDLAYFSLDFFDPHGTRKQMGWSDQAHWHPHCLRWAEVDWIARWVAAHDSRLPHPGVIAALLMKFVIIVDNENADHLFPTFEESYRSLNCLDENTIESLIRRHDYRRAHIEWRQHETLGWHMHQDRDVWMETGLPLYSLRRIVEGEDVDEDEQFPFMEWKNAVAATEQALRSWPQEDWMSHHNSTPQKIVDEILESGDLTACPILADALTEAGCSHHLVETLRQAEFPCRQAIAVEIFAGVTDGSLIDKVFGANQRQELVRHQINMEFLTFGSGHVVTNEEARQIENKINTELGMKGLGSMYLTGGGTSYEEDGTTVAEETTDYEIQIENDLDAGIEIVREVLHAHNFPADYVIEVRRPERREFVLGE